MSKSKEKIMSSKKQRKEQRLMKQLNDHRYGLINQITTRNTTSIYESCKTAKEMEAIRATWRQSQLEIGMLHIAPGAGPAELHVALFHFIHSAEGKTLIADMDTALLEEKQGEWSEPATLHVLGEKDLDLEFTFNRCRLGDIPILEVQVKVIDASTIEELEQEAVA
jgi:hypothetical protein